MDDKAPITLQTDASDYGMEAYLFQLVNGMERPVAFISKTFDKTQLKWSSIEKEGFLIYYSFNKSRHLIRDVPFILQTDHKKLIYINETQSQKVMKWEKTV